MHHGVLFTREMLPTNVTPKGLLLRVRPKVAQNVARPLRLVLANGAKVPLCPVGSGQPDEDARAGLPNLHGLFDRMTKTQKEEKIEERNF